MRRLLAAPFLAVVLSAQAQPDMVLSVGHAGPPSRAAFAGGHLATASSSTVALVDLSTGITIAHLPQASLVVAIEANPAGEVIAVGTCGHSIQLWDVRARTPLRRLALRQECAESLSFSPDGALLATGAYGCCSSGGLQIWDVRRGAVTRELATGSGIRQVLFSRDGRWLVGVDDRGTATVFEWPSGRPLRTFEGLDDAGASGSAALSSPDGKYFAWLGTGGLHAWDVKTGARIALPGAHSVTVGDRPPDGSERTSTRPQVTASAAEFLSDGRLAYIDDDRLLIVTLPSGPMQELALEQPTTEWFGDVAITQSPSWLRIRRDGRTIAGTFDSRTILWDVAAAKARELVSPALTDARSLEWSRSGVIVWADLQSGVRAWSDRSGEPVDLGRDIDFAAVVAFHPDGQRLAVADPSAIHILDVQRRRSLRSLEVPPTTRSGIAFSPDGSRVAFASSDGLALFDDRLRQHVRLATLEPYTSAEYVAFSPDGRWIAAGLGGPQPTVKVWPASGAVDAVTLDSNRLTYGPQPPTFSGNSRWLATFSKGQSLMLWSTGSWKVERTWRLPGTGRALAFAPHGSRLAIAADGEAAIWDASTGRRLVTLTSPRSSHATQVAWSPDGHRVVTAAADGVLRFWNATDGRLLASLYSLASSADWLLVAPDGRLDGSERALASLVAWRADDRVSLDQRITDGHRVRGLWQMLSPGASRR